MKLNSFQQAEVNNHNDAELLWIIQSEIELFKAEKSNFKDGKFNRFSLYEKVGIVITKTIAEREGFNDSNHMLSSKEAANFLWDSFKEKFPNEENIPKFNSYEELVSPFIDSLIYHSLLRTRTPLQEKNLINEYWPFGQEDGFCNPNKIYNLQN